MLSRPVESVIGTVPSKSSSPSLNTSVTVTAFECDGVMT
jgi:hypothetical protein